MLDLWNSGASEVSFPFPSLGALGGVAGEPAPAEGQKRKELVPQEKTWGQGFVVPRSARAWKRRVRKANRPRARVGAEVDGSRMI